MFYRYLLILHWQLDTSHTPLSPLSRGGWGGCFLMLSQQPDIKLCYWPKIFFSNAVVCFSGSFRMEASCWAR